MKWQLEGEEYVYAITEKIHIHLKRLENMWHMRLKGGTNETMNINLETKDIEKAKERATAYTKEILDPLLKKRLEREGA